MVQKQTKKQQQQNKKKKKPKPSKLKLKISKDNKRESSWGIAKDQPQKQTTKKPGSVTNIANNSVASGLSKTKRLEQRRAANAYHSTHCLMCDSNFETERRTYQRFSLKNRVNDEMDIAQVMEVRLLVYLSVYLLSNQLSITTFLHIHLFHNFNSFAFLTSPTKCTCINFTTLHLSTANTFPV